MTTPSIKIHVENWKCSSTKHCYRCCGIRVGTSGSTCWAPRSESRRPSFRAADINTVLVHGIWRSGTPHSLAASKSHCPQALPDRLPMLARPITASVNLPRRLILFAPESNLCLSREPICKDSAPSWAYRAILMSPSYLEAGLRRVLLQAALQARSSRLPVSVGIHL